MDECKPLPVAGRGTPCRARGGLVCDVHGVLRAEERSPRGQYPRLLIRAGVVEPLHGGSLRTSTRTDMGACHMFRVLDHAEEEEEED